MNPLPLPPLTPSPVKFEFWGKGDDSVAYLLLDNIPAEVGIETAYRAGRAIVALAKCGTEDTPYGKLPWLYLGVTIHDTLSSRKAKRFWMALIPDPVQFLGLKKWFGALVNQDTLYASIPIGSGESINVRILNRNQIEAWCLALDGYKAIAPGISLNSFNFDKALEYFQETSANTIQKALGIHMVLIWHDPVGGSAEVPADVIFTAIGKTFGQSLPWLLDSIKLIDQKASSIPRLHSEGSIDVREGMGMSINTEHEDERLVGDWVYLTVTARSRDGSHPGIVVGFSERGKFTYSRVIPYFKDSRFTTVLTIARQYRFLLPFDFSPVINFEVDYCWPIDENLCRFDLGECPTATDVEFLRKILVTSTLEQDFLIDRQTTIVVGLPGCEEITYAPVRGTLTNSSGILFKVTIERNGGINHVLFGVISPQDGEVNIVGGHQHGQTCAYIHSLEFLVAFGYRDLVVARHKFVETEPEKRADRPGAGFKKSEKQNRLPAIRLAPRFKIISVEGRAVSRVRQTVREVAPHYRSPTLRTLPEGWKASATQIERAKEVGWKVPEGRTFVTGSFVGGATAEHRDAVQKFKSLSLMEIMSKTLKEQSDR